MLRSPGRSVLNLAFVATLSLVLSGPFVPSLRAAPSSAPVAGLGAGAKVLAAPSSSAAVPDGREEMKRYRAQRLAAAEEVVAVGAHYSIAEQDETTLYLISQVDGPVALSLAAVNPLGERLDLGGYTLEKTEHLAIPLRPLLANAAPSFATGSLRLSFLGDTATVQGWSVLRRGRQTVEIPFQHPGNLTGWQYTTFWDTRPLGRRATAELYLLNSGEVPLVSTITLGGGAGKVETFSETLGPGQRVVLSLPGGRFPQGWLELRHDGEPSALIVAGLLNGRDHLSALRIVTPSEIEGGSSYDAIRLPVGQESQELSGRAAVARPVLSLHNPGREPIDVDLELIDQRSGARLVQHGERLAAGEVRSLAVHDLLADALGDRMPAEVRAHLESRGSFLVSGWSALPTGEVVDVAFFHTVDAHASGTYPMPNLRENEVFTTLVNLAGVEARVGAQVTWEGGTWAYGPVTIPPRGSVRLDYAKLAAEGHPDLLGRRLDPEYASAYLQWSTVGSQSESLIARTEVRPRQGRDTFGFNCFNCCPEFPWGSIIPSSVVFGVNQTVPFQACEWLDTCSGTLGPWEASPYNIVSPSPFIWTGSTVRATAPAAVDLSFDDNDSVLRASCTYITRIFRGFGTGDSCKALNPSGYNPAQTCSSQTNTCTKCCNCCTDLYRQQACKCKGSASCQTTAQQAFQLCKVHCVTDLNCNSSNYCSNPF